MSESKLYCLTEGHHDYDSQNDWGSLRAHPQAETHPSDDRGSQGNQEMIKGDSTPPKGDEKVDEAKVKEDTKTAREEFEKRNTKGQEGMETRSKGPVRSLQTH